MNEEKMVESLKRIFEMQESSNKKYLLRYGDPKQTAVPNKKVTMEYSQKSNILQSKDYITSKKSLQNGLRRSAASQNIVFMQDSRENIDVLPRQFNLHRAKLDVYFTDDSNMKNIIRPSTSIKPIKVDLLEAFPNSQAMNDSHGHSCINNLTENAYISLQNSSPKIYNDNISKHNRNEIDFIAKNDDSNETTDNFIHKLNYTTTCSTKNSTSVSTSKPPPVPKKPNLHAKEELKSPTTDNRNSVCTNGKEYSLENLFILSDYNSRGYENNLTYHPIETVSEQISDNGETERGTYFNYAEINSLINKSKYDSSQTSENETTTSNSLHSILKTNSGTHHRKTKSLSFKKENEFICYSPEIGCLRSDESTSENSSLDAYELPIWNPSPALTSSTLVSRRESPVRGNSLTDQYFKAAAHDRLYSASLKLGSSANSICRNLQRFADKNNSIPYKC